MSGSDDTKDGGRLFHFPRIVLPDSRDAPKATAEPGVEDDAPQAPAEVWPSLPHMSEMGPPLALTMPGIPDAGPDGSGDDEGTFAVPSPADPEHPTGRETLQIAMAIMTALGVAAAHGMWHRVRHRQALADQARANADKATAKAVGHKGSKESSLLRSPGSSGTKSSRSASGKNRPPKGPLSGSHHGPGRGNGKGGKAPKAGRGGKADWAGGKSKRRKRGSSKDSLGWLKRRGADRKPPKKPDTKAPKGGAGKSTPNSKTPKKSRGKLRWKAPRRGRGKGPKGWTSGRPKGAGEGKSKRKGPGKTRAGKLTWKASKRRPGPGGGKTSAGRKRWAARRKLKPVVKHRKKSWGRRARKGGAAWLKRWRASRRTGGKGAKGPGRSRVRMTWKPSAGDGVWGRRWFTKRTETSTSGSQGSGTTAPPPPPPPGFSGMRPPPAADRRVWATAERVDRPSPQEPLPTPALAGAPAGGRLALPAGSTPAPTAAANSNGAHFVSTRARSTQYRDAELTIFDVTDADADMAEEILAGVDDARATARSCERLYSTLEELHAKVVELKVPGVLERLVLRLMEKTASVRARAISISVHLPAASEAISIAGDNAAARHRPLADVTRDMGHVRPAERPYHLD